ncbi:MAG: nucleotidyltransferase domain-containing protein [Ruminococcus sp.]|nr:nucleotidyltransferase domain-containing protein [Ruminococcus sp.]
MQDIDRYLRELTEGCLAAFGERLIYIGLQGSYLRGEATPESDIDIMLVIEGLSPRDMDIYRELLKSLGHYGEACGFICGREELRRWNPLEVCQLLHTTGDVYGKLAPLLPPADLRDEISYVKLSLGNIYHELCHRYIHADREKNISKLRQTCKSLFFAVQNLHFIESGEFILTKRELKEKVSGKDRAVLLLSEPGSEPDFDEAFALLTEWIGEAFERTDKVSSKGEKL